MPDSFMDVLWYCWSAFTWFFHAEERLAIIFDNLGWANWKQVPILVAINMLIISWEVLMFSGITKVFNIDVKKPKTPSFVLKLTRGKPIGLPELIMLAFIPLCQKIGTFIYTTQRKYFGIKGYIALCCGGGLRLAIMAFLPKESLWYIIIGMIAARIITWWFENGYHRSNNKR